MNRALLLLLLVLSLEGCICVGYERYPTPQAGAPLERKKRSEINSFCDDPVYAKPVLAPGVTATLAFDNRDWYLFLGGFVLPLPIPIVPLPGLVEALWDPELEPLRLSVTIDSECAGVLDLSEIVLVSAQRRDRPSVVEHFDDATSERNGPFAPCLVRLAPGRTHFVLRYARRWRYREAFRVVIGGVTILGRPSMVPGVDYGPGAAWMLMPFP